jgi:integrase
MKKVFRKSIRIDGKLVSKEFTTAEAAKAWYSQLHSKKVLGDFGLSVPRSKSGVLLKDYALGEFMEHRRAAYPASTWKADEQRLRDHVLPALGNIPLAKIRVTHIRSFLSALVDKKKLSTKTRDRVQALISVIFTEAINRSGGPLVEVNPTFGITFRRGKRTGSKPPSYLHTHAQCIAYLRAARELSPMHFAVGCMGLMAGLRKQEMIALRFRHVDVHSMTLEVSEKYVQASHKIVRGTKAGDESIRYVPMSDDLTSALHEIQHVVKYGTHDDFILQNADRTHMSPKQVYNLNAETCERAGVRVTVHGLRHTFGREFAERSGNVNALKDILGHSNLSTTQLYSSLGKERLKGFRDVMKFDI